MLRRVGLLLSVCVIATGCGSGSDRADQAATTPSPAVYSAAQLEDALPVAGDLPRDIGATITFVCPRDEKKKLCPPKPEEATSSTGGTVDAASPVGAEQITRTASPIDFFAVDVQEHATVAEAEQQRVTRRKAAEQHDGKFAIKDKKLENGSTLIGAVGTGSMKDLAIGPWSGFATSWTSRSADSPASDQGLLVANFMLANEKAHVAVFVSLSAADRDPVAATALADSLVRDYLERLG